MRARPQLGRVVGDREPGDDDQRRVVGMALALAALVVAAIVFWSIVPRGTFGGGVLGATASPSGSVAAVLTSPTPTLSSSPTPTPTPTPTQSPTPTPTPTATVRPTTAPPPPVSGPTRSPSQTVARFYELVAAHQFSAAAQLWSPRMRAEYPPSRYINSRFAHTTRIVLHRNETISMSLSRGTAVVAVDLTEYRDNGPARRWIGRWDMVLTSSGWLMDEPHF